MEPVAVKDGMLEMLLVRLVGDLEELLVTAPKSSEGPCETWPNAGSLAGEGKPWTADWEKPLLELSEVLKLDFGDLSKLWAMSRSALAALFLDSWNDMSSLGYLEEISLAWVGSDEL